MARNRQEVEAKGPSVEAAIERGLEKLGLTRSDVVVEVLDEGSRGLLGIGSRDAVVKLTAMMPSRSQQKSSPPSRQKPAPKKEKKEQPKPKPAQAKQKKEKPKPPKKEKKEAEEEKKAAAPAPAKPKAEKEREAAPEPKKEAAAEKEDEATAVAQAEEAVTVAESLLEEMLDKMGVSADITRAKTEPDPLTGKQLEVLQVEGDDLGVLIGPRGDTLNALQYILRLMVGHKLRRRARFIIDVGGYRRKREKALARLAERMAEKAIKRESAISLEPMPPNERRVIHMTLREHDEVYTNSIGQGKNRKVRIYLKDE